ncbi:MAG TPA: TonB-dependent receptor, partial [Clostridia bacterium]|nr:TonB-dependent receptor [Clostridia bacterium]
HLFIWGGGYRLASDDIPSSPVLSFIPSSRELQLFSVFAQDEFKLVPDKVQLKLGAQLEHNDYSGLEFQPNVRLAWTPTERQTVWGAVSRAVRSPSRIDRDLLLRVGPITVLGSGNSDSEKLLAYELGYRIQPQTRLIVSLAAFYNDYDDVHSLEPSSISPTTLISGSGLWGRSWGAELSLTCQATDRWRLRGGYTYFDKRLFPKSGRVDITQGAAEGNDPRHQLIVQSMLDLPFKLELDLIARYVHALPAPHVPGYFTMDVRVAWKPHPNLEIAVIGQDLWDERHAEFGAAQTRQEIPRSVYGKLTWRF